MAIGKAYLSEVANARSFDPPQSKSHFSKLLKKAGRMTGTLPVLHSSLIYRSLI